jgi:pimeloyl-ACP methyl ester carboxylesterase
VASPTHDALPDPDDGAGTMAAPGRVDAGDVELALLERGEGPLVVCLHGFPGSAWSMVGLLETLADAGFRAVAPATRGYAPSGRPPGRTTTLLDLARDAIAVADALGEEELMIVGHDWGAVTAYAAANLAPHRVHRIVAVAVPHPAAVLRSPSLGRLWRSRHMLQFQVPDLPERLIARTHLRWIDDLARRWSPTWDPTEDELATLRRGLEGPGRLAAALGYYRGLPRGVVDPEVRRVALGRVPVPALVINGEDDACVAPGLYAGMEDLFPGGLTRASIPGAGHFVHLEAPDAFAEHALAHLTAG